MDEVFKLILLLQKGLGGWLGRRFLKVKPLVKQL
jgi:hypothetical protein